MMRALQVALRAVPGMTTTMGVGVMVATTMGPGVAATVGMVPTTMAGDARFS
jgi:hypothetical protein